MQPYPGPGLRQQVTSRGNYPVWRKDGREIVYFDEFQGRSYIWSVPVTATGGEFRPGTHVRRVWTSETRTDIIARKRIHRRLQHQLLQQERTF